MLGGFEVRKDDQIFINIRGLHFDKRYWDDPETFDPERFSAERSKGRHKWAFLPFLNGPRKCIGEPLSRVEMQLILATILQRYRLHLPEGAGWLEVRQEDGYLDADIMWRGGSVVPVSHVFIHEGKLHISRTAGGTIARANDRKF